MNTKTIIILTTLCPAFCFGQSNVVYYGVNSNALNVAFVDTNLSKKVQSAIVADLRVCLQEWGKTSELRLRQGKDSVGYLDNFQQCPHYPGAIKFPENVISNATVGLALRVPKDLSDAYTNAFAFAAANAFVKLISSNGFVNTLMPANISQYILYEQYKAEDYVTDFQDLKKTFVEVAFLQPSVLGLVKTGMSVTPSNSLLLRLPGYLNDPLGPSPILTMFPAIWHDGKWKIYYNADWD